MDDRTIIARDTETLDKMKATWKKAADECHLIENEAKAQTVDHNLDGSSFGVLGALLGHPTKKALEESRIGARLEKATNLYRKIGILPQGMSKKMKDCSMYGRSLLAYGWIDVNPPSSWIEKQSFAYWRTAGRTGYANPHMKQVVGGAHSALDMVSFLKQLRLLAQRDQGLNAAKIHIEPCALENVVETYLDKLNWNLEGGRYRHSLYREGLV